MNVIFAQEDLSTMTQPSIFLAGPTPRDEGVESWRPQALKELEKLGYKGSVLIPELRGGWDTNVNFEKDKQIAWETKALYESTVILFWVPREKEFMPAFTTNIEFGMWLIKDPKKIAIGWPEDAFKMDFIEYKAKENFIKCHKTLESVVEHAVYKAKYN